MSLFCRGHQFPLHQPCSPAPEEEGERRRWNKRVDGSRPIFPLLLLLATSSLTDTRRRFRKQPRYYPVHCPRCCLLPQKCHRGMLCMICLSGGGGERERKRRRSGKEKLVPSFLTNVGAIFAKICKFHCNIVQWFCLWPLGSEIFLAFTNLYKPML